MNRTLVFTLSLLCLVLGMSRVCAGNFTLQTRVDFDFVHHVHWIGEGSATAVLSLSGTMEPGSDGAVTITGTGSDGALEPFTVALSQLTPSGGLYTFDVPLPDVPGDYTYTASYSVHTQDNTGDHDPPATLTADPVTITMVDV